MKTRPILLQFKVAEFEAAMIDRAAELSDPKPRGRRSRFMRDVLLDAARRRITRAERTANGTGQEDES